MDADSSANSDECKNVTPDRVEPSKDTLDHAWRYFALHADQRFSVFNFYIVFIGLSSAGLGAALQGPTRFAFLGVVLGIFISLLSFLFWKLDQRGSMLIKHSEEIIRTLEPLVIGHEGALFAKEYAVSQTAHRSWAPLKTWSFGQSLRLIFCTMGIFGVGSATLSGFKAAGIVSWETATRSGNTVACNSGCMLIPLIAATTQVTPATKTAILPTPISQGPGRISSLRNPSSRNLDYSGGQLKQ